jgi:multiple sugar transport system substrate-binding protein
MITYSNTVPTALKADITPLNWDMVSIPIFSQSMKTGTQATPVYFGVASFSEHKEEAARAVEYFSSIEFSVANSKAGVLMASTAPEVVKALGTETAFPDKNWKAIRYYPFAPLSPKAIYSTEVLNAYNKNVVPLVAGQVDLNTALRTMEEAAQKEIDTKLKK